MKRWIAVALTMVLCSVDALAQSEDSCTVPGYLLYGDSLLERAHVSTRKTKALKIVIVGGTSSTLPGPDGANFAYPARLEAALKRRLPGLSVTVVANVKPRRSAAEIAENIDKLPLDEKPVLVIWQTGTYDAVRGTDLAEFRDSLAKGVEAIQAEGMDIVLVNMQYSPRTELIVAVGPYADGMRWVARERAVPLFDRLAIMRHWYDSGQINLYAATKDLGVAKRVHDCVGRALAALIIDAARLDGLEGPAVQ
jgi:hypothetical protein